MLLFKMPVYTMRSRRSPTATVSAAKNVAVCAVSSSSIFSTGTSSTKALSIAKSLACTVSDGVASVTFTEIETSPSKACSSSRNFSFKSYFVG